MSQGLGNVSASIWDVAQLDARLLTGNEGDALLASTPSQTGALAFTSVGTNLQLASGIGGSKCINTDNGPSGALNNYVTCNPLAARITAGSIWTIRSRARSNQFQDVILWAAGSSATSTSRYLKLQVTTVGAVQLVSCTDAGGVIVRTSVGLDVQKDPHIFDVSTDGSNYFLQVDGVSVAFDTSACDPNPVIMDRFAISALLSTAAGLRSTTYWQFFGMASAQISAAALTLAAMAYAAGDFTLPYAASPELAWLGDSITEAAYVDGGMRRLIVNQFIVPNGLSLWCPGQSALGVFPNHQGYAVGGSDLLTIANLFTLNIGSAAPRLAWFMGGTNNQTQSQAGAQADYGTAFQQIMNLGVSRNAAFELLGVTIVAFNPTGVAPAPTQAANQAVFNAWLKGTYWPAHSTKLLTFDAAAAAGPWSAGGWVDNTHPNITTDQSIVDAFILQYGTKLVSISATANPLAAVMTGPAAGASVAVGATINLAAVVTRVPSSVQFFDGGTLIASATMGGQTNKNASASFVASGPGVHSLTARVTNTLTGETSTSAPVLVTFV